MSRAFQNPDAVCMHIGQSIRKIIVRGVQVCKQVQGTIENGLDILIKNMYMCMWSIAYWVYVEMGKLLKIDELSQ